MLFLSNFVCSSKQKNKFEERVKQLVETQKLCSDLRVHVYVRFKCPKTKVNDVAIFSVHCSPIKNSGIQVKKVH